MAPGKPHDTSEEALGILYAGGSYVLWGFVPLYWALLPGVSPYQITMHRIFWGALLTVMVTLVRGRWREIVAIFAKRETILALAISSVLIAANWTIFIWCVSTHQLVESSLGYYLTPLVSMALGLILLGEKISRLRLVAIGLAALSVIVQAFELGQIPWPAPALALSFGFYGYVRKRTPVDALDGLTVETMLLFPITALVLGYLALKGTGAFTFATPWRDALLAGGGPITAIPLTMFAAGARRVRMTTLGFLQYLAPSLTLLVATLLMGEPFTRTDVITFAFVWSALAIVGLEGPVLRARARRPA